jgi:hypothetical protein
MRYAYRPRPSLGTRGSLYSQELDPLQASVPLEFHHVLFPFGFPTHIKTNDRLVIRAAEASWAIFKHGFGLPPIEVRVVVSDVVSRRIPPIPTFRAQLNLLTLVADEHNFGCCDLANGFGFACLTKAATTHRDYIRHHFLESMVYTLLDTRHTVAIHAACLEFLGRGCIFAGNSGAGKSSLSYACARRGWTYICDDATCLLINKTGRRIVGNPQTLRFRPSALALFPEIKGTSRLRNGKPTLEIRTERLRNIKIASESTVDFIIFLNRSETMASSPTLVPVNRQDAFRRLSNNPWPCELAINEQRSQAIERLLTAQAFELSYWEFNAAIELLENVVRGEQL